MAIKDYLIRVYPSKVGTQLNLSFKYKRDDYTHWAIDDAFNGLTRLKPINENIFGIFQAGLPLDLLLYKNGKLVKKEKGIRVVKGGTL